MLYCTFVDFMRAFFLALVLLALWQLRRRLAKKTPMGETPMGKLSAESVAGYGPPPWLDFLRLGGGGTVPLPGAAIRPVPPPLPYWRKFIRAQEGDLLLADVVRLRSGGPQMVVTDLESGCAELRVWVVWFDGLSVARATFGISSLDRRLRPDEATNEPPFLKFPRVAPAGVELKAQADDVLDALRYAEAQRSNRAASH